MTFGARTTQQHPATTHLPSNIWRHQRPTMVLWPAPIGMLMLATATNNVRVGQWALLLAMMCTVLCCTRLAQYVVTRLTQIVALWEEDVPQPTGVAPLYSIPIKHPVARERSNDTA